MIRQLQARWQYGQYLVSRAEGVDIRYYHADLTRRDDASAKTSLTSVRALYRSFCSDHFGVLLHAVEGIYSQVFNYR